jgi:pilus assembly protein CpaB
LVVVAVVLALGGTLAVYTYAHNADKRAVENTRAASVLIVKKTVPVGTTWADAIKNGFFSQEHVPVSSAPSSAVADTSAAIPVDAVATSTISSGQIVVREMFGTRTPTTGILAIPKGLMAVSVSLPANSDVAGFVQNGSEVAIFSTFKVKRLNGNESGQIAGDDLYTTKLLLPRATVVATSQDAPSDLSGGNSSNNSTTNVLITVALSQSDAERVILAQQIGQLYLGLLSADSVTDTNDGGIVNLLVFKPTPIFVK